MKKRIIAAAVTLLICLSSVCSVSAYTNSHVVDVTDILTYSELDELESYASYIENTYGWCVMFCITDDTGDMSGDEYVKEIYDMNTDNDNGIIITHDTWNSTYYVYVSGDAELIDTADIDDMREAYDSNESYYDGIYDYLETAEGIIESAVYSYEEPEKGDETPDDYEYINDASDENAGLPLSRIPVALVIGWIVGFVIIYSIASKNKSVKMQKNATVYTRQGSLVITGKADNFLYSNVDRREKPKPQNNTKS